ncbi:MAG: hypothetical protein H6584_02095 [Flavobacteriales bacterium]|nr:hypothetical protein [Flavobacteriales bacterium]
MKKLLILLALIFIVVTYRFFSNRTKNKKTKDLIDEICNAHQSINYPELDKKTQLEILLTGNLTPIGELVSTHKDKGVPVKLLKNYITISKKEICTHLIDTGYIDKRKIENASNPKEDGIWILKDKIIDQERGNTHQEWKISSIEDAADVFADLLWEKFRNYDIL